MKLTKSFPPVDALLEIDYRKHYNNFMDFVVIVCATVAAIATVLYNHWQKHSCTERLQLFVINVIEGAKTFYDWTQNVFVPECISLYHDVRKAYTYLRTV